MKTILEFIQQTQSTHTPKPKEETYSEKMAKKYNVDRLCDDIVSIFKKHNVTEHTSSNKDKMQYDILKLNNAEQRSKIELYYLYSTTGMSNRFYLTFEVFFAKDVNRPRYSVDFGITLPATNKGGYRANANFGAKKVNHQYYTLAIDHIKDLCDRFCNNTTAMDKIYSKTFGKSKKPQRKDMEAAFNTIYGDLNLQPRW